MKLTISGKQVALPSDAKISIEKTSSFTGDETGSFSYPFPVPTLPNQQLLQWPGKLQRAGDLPDQTFILEDSGLQIFRGEVDYEDITSTEIGLILKSGYTEFYKKMEGKMLSGIDYGSESWPISSATSPNLTAINAKMTEWNNANSTDNGKYVLSQFIIKMLYAQGDLYVNKFFHTTGANGIRFLWQAGAGAYYACYGLQFKVFFLISKIFESAGYTIAEEVLSQSPFFNKLVIFSNIISINVSSTGSISPVLSTLKYAMLMPEIEVLTFLESFKNMFCLLYEIDERKKEVRIKFKNDVFRPENLDPMNIRELTGWVHSEQKSKKGFALRYTSQENELDTWTDFPAFIDVVPVLPAPSEEGKIVMSSFGRYYITQNNEGVLEWNEVGRLREVSEGESDNISEIKVIVPPQKRYKIVSGANEWNLECPVFNTIFRDGKLNFIVIPQFAVTLYHGIKTMDGISIPYASFDRFSLDNSIDTGMSLKPVYLYENFYEQFLDWQTYRARSFTKYIQLTLTQVLALQWGKRYNINGIEIILDKINFELPHHGTVKIEGYTS